jgi:hypothetical protein
MKITREEAFQLLQIEVGWRPAAPPVALRSRARAACRVIVCAPPCTANAACAAALIASPIMLPPPDLQETEDELVIKQAYKRLALKWCVWTLRRVRRRLHNLHTHTHLAHTHTHTHKHTHTHTRVPVARRLLLPCHATAPVAHVVVLTGDRAARMRVSATTSLSVGGSDAQCVRSHARTQARPQPHKHTPLHKCLLPVPTKHHTHTHRHPDKNGNSEEATEKFQRVAAACECA